MIYWGAIKRLVVEHDAFVVEAFARINARLSLSGESLDEWV
ncbi:MAG: hypothetical protein OEQ39_28785 [Gammaproteobacteria bacterium]|nr:hypothetical protein [Gammaproteobacteria bacterium]